MCLRVWRCMFVCVFERVLVIVFVFALVVVFVIVVVFGFGFVFAIVFLGRFLRVCVCSFVCLGLRLSARLRLFLV